MRKAKHGTDFLSTAGSLRLPIGSKIKPGEIGGYYIDFTSKVTDPRWPPDWLAPREEQFHVATIQWALGCFETYLLDGNERWLDASIAAGRYLAGLQREDGGWAHLFSMPHTFTLRPGWLSALPQGEGASLFVRLHRETGDDEFAERAALAIRPLEIPVQEGGLTAPLAGGTFLEEYPTDPPSYVLNGAIFALWGLYDVGLGLDDRSAMSRFEAGVDLLAATIDQYDLGYWSSYDLYPHPVVNVASGAYHELHINQLRAMALVAPRPAFDRISARFEHYRDSRLCRWRAFAEKVYFRLRVPRRRVTAPSGDPGTQESLQGS
jgi:heparosan-N-sulfate-glucuronate 5-epimerase